MTDRQSVEALVDGVLTRHGRIDVLVNNAGIARDQLMLRMKREEWDEVIATNLTAAFTCVHAVLKPMIKRRAGRIISISSVVGQMGNAGPGQLRSVEGWVDWVQQGAGARSGLTEYHGQRRGARAWWTPT